MATKNGRYRHGMPTRYVSFMMLLIFLFCSKLLHAAAFLTTTGQHKRFHPTISCISANMCPEIPLIPRPGNEMAIVACG
jgi:hypothetical protein